MGEILNMADLEDRLDGNHALIREIAALFLEDYPGRMADIRSALDRGSATEVAESAHTLKGSAGSLGAEAVLETARRVEMLARESNLTEAGEAYGVLERELDRLKPILTAMEKDTTACQ